MGALDVERRVRDVVINALQLLALVVHQPRQLSEDPLELPQALLDRTRLFVAQPLYGRNAGDMRLVCYASGGGWWRRRLQPLGAGDMCDRF